MRVLMICPGTRGDVAPMAGLGSRLQKLGYEVSIAANPAYAHLVVRSGCEYRPLPGDLARIIKRATPGGAKSSGGMLTTWRELSEYMDQAATGTLAAVEAGADVILANSVAPYAYDVAEAVGIPAVGAHLQPVEPSADYPPVLLGSARNLGGLGNRIIGERVLAGPAPYDAPSARLRHELGLPKLSRQAAERRRARASSTVLHGISPTVLPRPTDWRPGLVMAGYWWPAPEPEWSPSAELEDFLSAGPPPVFVGFGSSAALEAGFVLEAIRRASGRCCRVRGTSRTMMRSASVRSRTNGCFRGWRQSRTMRALAPPLPASALVCPRSASRCIRTNRCGLPGLLPSAQGPGRFPTRGSLLSDWRTPSGKPSAPRRTQPGQKSSQRGSGTKTGSPPCCRRSATSQLGRS